MTLGPQRKPVYFPIQNTWGKEKPKKVTYAVLHKLKLLGLTLMQFNTFILDLLKQLTSMTAELNGNLHLLFALQNAQFLSILPYHYLICNATHKQVI